jgi:hypothetical protein
MSSSKKLTLGKSLIMKRSSLTGGGGGITYTATRKGKWRRIQFGTATTSLSIFWYLTISTPYSRIFQVPSPILNYSTLYHIHEQHKSGPEATVDRTVPGEQNDKWNEVE